MPIETNTLYNTLREALTHTQANPVPTNTDDTQRSPLGVTAAPTGCSGAAVRACGAPGSQCHGRPLAGVAPADLACLGRVFL